MNASHPKPEPVAQGPVCRRRRGHLALAGGLVVAAGLGSRAFPFLVPASLGKYPGDALWATMVLFGLAFLRPAARPLHLAIFALSLSWLVEFSQLYQADWINSLRATRVGHLALGSTFHGADLPAYAAGVLIGLGLDIVLLSGRRPGIREQGAAARTRI